MGKTHEEHDAVEHGTTITVTGSGYRILRPIGRGGAGDVFEAEHLALNQRVVLKILRKRAQNRPDLVHRMRIEAMALCRLRHPNLVEVHDFGCTADGRPFLVMELLEGHTLREELKQRGRIPVLEAIEITRQILAGLGAVHRAGIVHRDIKLDNLFVCFSSQNQSRLHNAAGKNIFKSINKNIKILDLGMAKVLAAGELSREPNLPIVRTDTGQSLGTPRFFSPEQALNNPVDARSDLYAVGAVLYTLIAGRGPFDHYDALYDLVRAHAHEIPEPPSTLCRSEIPIELDHIILKALSKQPEERFDSAEAFSDALSNCIPKENPANIAVPKRWTHTEKMTPPSTAPAPKPYSPWYRLSIFIVSAAASALCFAFLSHLLLKRLFSD